MHAYSVTDARPPVRVGDRARHGGRQYARRNGYSATRFVTRMEWALRDSAYVEALVEYEAKANYAVESSGDPVICVYDLAR